MSEQQKKMVNCKIDNQPLSVEQGTTILEAAETIGIKIPHFCYHQGIGIDGNCRLCLVEIKGAPKLVISCATEVSPDSEIFTASDKVIKARQGVLEFILLNHPLDCPICDKGGECPLQNYTFAHRLGFGRFNFARKEEPKHQIIGQHIMLDNERCILCSRCVRYQRDIVGREELTIKQRGNNAEVVLFPGKQLSSDFSGNLTDFCPVGALTCRHFRFQARPWEIDARDSSCGGCSLNCSIQHWYKGNKFLRTTPRIDPQVNAFWLCDKGRYLENRLSGAKRIKKPMLGKEQQSFVKAYQLLRQIVSKSSKIYFKPDSTLANEEFALLYAAADKLKNLKIIVPGGFKSLAKKYTLLREKELAAENVSNLLQAEHILLLGADPYQDQQVLALIFRKYLLDKMGKITFVGEQQSEICNLAEFKKYSANELDIKELIGKADKEQQLAIIVSAEYATDKTFADLIALAEEKKGKLSINLALNGVNSGGWALVNQQYPESSLEEQEITEIAANDLLYLVNGEEEQPHTFGAEQFVAESYFANEALEKARLIFPQESALGKSGSYLNTFSKVQKLNRAVAVIDVNHFGYRHLQKVLNIFAADLNYAGLEEIYLELLAKIKGMPADYSAIKRETKYYQQYVTKNEKTKNKKDKTRTAITN